MTDIDTPRTRLAVGVGGIVFIALVASSIFVVPNPPNPHASAAKVVAYYHHHRTGAGVSGFLIVLAVVVGIPFFWYLRGLVATTPSSRQLAIVGFAGSLLFAVTGGLAAGAFYTLHDVVGHVDPSTLQAINLIQVDVTNGVGAAGVAVFLLATGYVVARGAGEGALLPVWVGYVGIVLGVASIVINPLSLPAMGLWLLIVSIVLLARSGGSTTTP